MPEMDTPVADASWSVVVAPRPVKPCNWKLRRGSKMRRGSVATERGSKFSGRIADLPKTDSAYFRKVRHPGAAPMSPVVELSGVPGSWNASKSAVNAGCSNADNRGIVLDVRPIIPTASKAKIHNRLSCPIGAEQISKALAATVQFSSIQLRFHASLGDGLSIFKEFLRVEYLNDVQAPQQWPIFPLYPRPDQSRWELVVQPVRRSFRHEVKDYILSVALPDIDRWLIERAELNQKGSDILAFFSDDSSANGFARHHLTRLEPLRKPSARRR